MVKGAVISVKAKPITTVHIKKKRYKKCCMKSCSSYVHAICKDNFFATNMPDQSTNKCNKCHEKYAQVAGGGYAGVVLEAKRN